MEQPEKLVLNKLGRRPFLPVLNHIENEENSDGRNNTA